MITFETEEEFQEAVIKCKKDNLVIDCDAYTFNSSTEFYHPKSLLENIHLRIRSEDFSFESAR